MTNREKIAELINIRDKYNYTLAPREVFDDAIKALEHDEVLDKIRAEIDDEIISHSGTGEEVIQAYVDGLLKAVKIIDKYRKEDAE